MIKREFRTLEFFLDSFTEKELPPATKLIIASRLKETFSKITDFDKIQKDNLCNNAIINSHGREKIYS